jgi:hypothetical protein
MPVYSDEMRRRFGADAVVRVLIHGADYNGLIRKDRQQLVLRAIFRGLSAGIAKAVPPTELRTNPNGWSPARNGQAGESNLSAI